MNGQLQTLLFCPGCVRDSVAVAKPTELAADWVTDSSFIASWKAVPGVTSYRLDVSLSSDFVTVASSSTGWEITGLQPATTYYFRVTALFGGVAGPVSDTATVTTWQDGLVRVRLLNLPERFVDPAVTMTIDHSSYRDIYSWPSLYPGGTLGCPDTPAGGTLSFPVLIEMGYVMVYDNADSEDGGSSAVFEIHPTASGDWYADLTSNPQYPPNDAPLARGKSSEDRPGVGGPF